MNLTEYYKFRALMGNISGGGGGATTLVIYDADIVLEYQLRDNPYEGHFTPQTEPDTTQPVTIVLNGNTYTTLPPESNDNYYIWEVDVDHGVIWLVYASDSGQCHFGATEEYLPSTEHEQTLPLKITQTTSGGGGTSDDSFAKLIDRSIVTAVIPDGVTSIGDHAFAHCTNLTSITIPNSVTRIENGAFAGCSSLTSIELPSGITELEGSTFTNCTLLAEIEIPSGVTSIGSADFANCTSLTDIAIPSGVTSIGGRAFASCTSLETITCNATVPPSINTSTGTMGTFYQVPADCAIYVPAESVDTYKATAGWSDRAAYIQAIESDDEEDEV